MTTQTTFPNSYNQAEDSQRLRLAALDLMHERDLLLQLLADPTDDRADLISELARVARALDRTRTAYLGATFGDPIKLPGNLRRLFVLPERAILRSIVGFAGVNLYTLDHLEDWTEIRNAVVRRILPEEPESDRGLEPLILTRASEEHVVAAVRELVRLLEPEDLALLVARIEANGGAS